MNAPGAFEPLRIPPALWQRDDVRAALRERNIQVLFLLLRQYAGASQTRIGMAVGMAQSHVSAIMRGMREVTDLATFERIADGLDMPDLARGLLGLASKRLDGVGDSSTVEAEELTAEALEAGQLLERLDPPLHMVRLGEQGPGGDDPTRRRDLLKTAALAGVTPLLPGGAHGEGSSDDTTPGALRAVTGAQRRLDAIMPSHELVEPVAAHLRLTHQLVDKATPDVRGMAAVASEAAGFAAWLHFDMADLGTAQRYYRQAVAHALQTGHGLLSGYMLGSRAAFEVEGGDPTRGLNLLEEAGDHFGHAPPPTAVAWLSSLQALGFATRGRTTDAYRCIRVAEAGASRARDTEAPWPWVFPFDSAKVAGYRALCAVRLARPAEALAIFAELESPRSPKQAALIELERARAHLRLEQPDEGFASARQALTTGISAESGRVVRRARWLRRCYQGPTTTAVRAFDTQLRQAEV